MALGEELQGAERQAWQEAEAAGRAAGLAAAQRQYEAKLREANDLCASLHSALNALSRPLAHVDDDVHSQIVLLAVALARGLVRRELRTDPTQIIGVVRETVSLLPASARGVRVVLHPEDAALVRQRLPVNGPDQAWSIADDPVLARGDCRVFTEFAQIDARVESRLNEAIAALLGEERAQARGTEQA
jgi:flagellar assembly protein FliH